jgi:hypothetical protein
MHVCIIACSKIVHVWCVTQVVPAYVFYILLCALIDDVCGSSLNPIGVCTWICLHVFACMYVYMHMYKNKREFTVHACMRACVCVNVYLFVFMYAFGCICVCMYTCM